MRLAGGRHEKEGRLEVCMNGVWGAVAHYAWTFEDATVVCRQLGFPFECKPLSVALDINITQSHSYPLQGQLLCLSQTLDGEQTRY